MADAIVSGTYPAGSWISEQELADLFGVSRGPIREALRLLDKEGLVTILPRRGTMVTQLTREEVIDIFAIRAALMGAAGKQATERLNDETRTELQKSLRVLDGLSKGEDPREFLRAAYEASMLLARSSGNHRLFELILAMARLTLPLTIQALTDPKNRMAWTKNWRFVVDSVVRAEAQDAEEAAQRLVLDTGRRAAEFAADARARPLSSTVLKKHGIIRPSSSIARGVR